MVQAGLRDLPAAYIIDGDGVPVIETSADSQLPYVVPPMSALAQAASGQVALLMPGSNTHRVGAVAKLESYPGKYLYVMRGVSPKVIEHLRLTAQNVDEFNRLRKARGGLKIAHGLMYLMISMTAVLAAIWVGLWFAGRFVAPIRRLIGAAQDVSTGNLMVELPEKRGEGDLRRLSQTFNTMTRELKTSATPWSRPTSNCSNAATSWKRCCRACRRASSASTAKIASPSSAAPPATCWEWSRAISSARN